MKSFRNTFIFAGVVAATLGYAYFFEYKKKIEDEAKKEEQQKIFSFKSEDIQSVRLEKGQTAIEVEKVDGLWKLISPVQDRADSSVMSELTTMLVNEKSDTVAEEGDSINPRIFGLENPMGKISVKVLGGQNHEVLIGSESAMGGKRYVVRNSEKKVLVVGYGLEGQLNKTPKDFRDKKLFPFSMDDIVHLRLTFRLAKDRGTVELEKKDNKWILKSRGGIEASPPAVSDYLNQLIGVSASDIPSDQKSNSAELKKYNMGSPHHIVEVKTSKGEEWKFEGGVAKDAKIFASVSGRPSIFELPQSVVEALVKSDDDFRDRKAPFRFNRDQATQIKLKTSLLSLNLKKSGGKWDSDPQLPEKKEIDQEQVNSLLDRLGEMETKKFLGQGKGIKLDSPQGEIVLSDQGGTEILNFRWSDNKSDDSLFLARTNSSDELLGIERSRVASFPIQTLVRDKVVVTPKPETPATNPSSSKSSAPPSHVAP